mgnify:CR=1 FL=1|jgi:hypothetical protein|tara:strand:- start:702 stop:1415 length:714 start_codon:yes stop_codon:yes gene_type:complete
MVRKRRKKSKNYFTQETEDYIVLFNSLDSIKDEEQRSKIYEAHIHYPFFKLTQNIIHTFKFYHTEVENLEHLQHEIITFLLSKIHLFDPSRGAKAYSYFGTIVKRWLILYNTKNYNKKIKKVPVDDLLKESSTHTYNMGDDRIKSDLDKYVDIFVNHVSENIFELFPKKNDAQIADAILELFRKRESLEVFNKKALYIYIREMVEVKTPKITKIADKLHTIFKSQYIFYLENGYTRF